MSLCKSIDTLSMAYLDDELATEERHEVETHLAECATCRAHLERERADASMVRRALVAPPASDLFKARIARALDDEERATGRRRWSQYVLPGSAILAAAAAIMMFVGVHSPAPAAEHNMANTVSDAARFGRRQLPLEVQGASTGPWLAQTLAADVAPPQFEEPSTVLLGGRLLPGAINGHDAAALSYLVDLPNRPAFKLSVLVVRDLRGEDLRDGSPVRVNGRTLYVYKSNEGLDIVSYVPRESVGFMFVAPELTVNELLGLVSRTNLVSE